MKLHICFMITKSDSFTARGTIRKMAFDRQVNSLLWDAMKRFRDSNSEMRPLAVDVLWDK